MRANPFSTCFTRPGAIEYRFPAAVAIDQYQATPPLQRLIDRLIHEWHGHPAAAIVGPHGTGKSTCLMTLQPCWEHHFQQQTTVQLTAEDRSSLPLIDHWLQEHHDRQPLARLLVIDGFEQIGWWQRRRLLRRLHRAFRQTTKLPAVTPSAAAPRISGPRWLLTAHRHTQGVPTVLQTDWDDPIVAQLTEERIRSLPTDQQAGLRQSAIDLVASARQTRNVRDYWFALYDEFERGRNAVR